MGFSRADQAPYHLLVDVTQGQTEPRNVGGRYMGPPPEGFQDELRVLLVDAIAVARCFDEVTAFDPDREVDADLLLVIEVNDFYEETEHALKQHAYNDPNADPDRAKMKFARIQASYEFFLTTANRAHTLRDKSARLFEDHLPRHEEDPTYFARNEMLVAAASMGRSFACKGSPKKLAKQLEALTAGD